MAHLTVRTPFGLGLLKAACLLFGLFSLLDLIPGVYSGGANQSGAIVSHRISWLVSVLNLSLFALAFYGLQRRSAIAWKLGWAFLGAFFSEMVVFCLASTVRLQQPDRWIASVAVVAGCTAVAVYWGFWWKRQKGHFLPSV
jgi:hypothetical protein